VKKPAANGAPQIALRRRSDILVACRKASDIHVGRDAARRRIGRAAGGCVNRSNQTKMSDRR